MAISVYRAILGSTNSYFILAANKESYEVVCREVLSIKDKKDKGYTLKNDESKLYA